MREDQKEDEDENENEYEKHGGWSHDRRTAT
jgi:hypothetical protein